ncbi:MAG: hypothetical protein Q7S22_01430, partial [Candidatus Micrarchaeota archaeon]|nr:hypothetical protein [Candidatus Micrarchaeota archaeon]
FALLEIASDKTNSDKKRERAGMKAIDACVENRDKDIIAIIAIGNGGEGTIISEKSDVESGTHLFRSTDFPKKVVLKALEELQRLTNERRKELRIETKDDKYRKTVRKLADKITRVNRSPTRARL